MGLAGIDLVLDPVEAGRGAAPTGTGSRWRWRPGSGTRAAWLSGFSLYMGIRTEAERLYI